MINEAASVDIAQYTAQYELLRAQVIGARGDAAQPDAVAQPRGVGLALLLREGVPGWLKEIESVIRASPALRTTDPAVSPPSETLAGYDKSAPARPCGAPRHDLTELLTSLVLSTRRLQCAH